MHSFAVTENYIILVEYPLVVRPLDLFFRRRPFIECFRWEPDRGTRFIVVDRNGHGLRGTHHSAPIFAFHHINAYEQDDQLVLDLAAYEDKNIIDSLYLDQLRDEAGAVPLAELARYRIPLDGSSVTCEPMMDLTVELPRINYRACNTKRHRFVYAVSRTAAAHGIYNRLVKADLVTGESEEWAEDSCFPGEPVFVASPGARVEDEGVVHSVVLDVKRRKSFLLVLDAHSFRELGRAEVPQHVPFGFHGQFYEQPTSHAAN